MDPQAYLAAMRASMKERTGKTLEEWVAIIKETLPAAKKGRLKWFKETYGLSQNSAMLIMETIAKEGVSESEQAAQLDDVVDRMFANQGPELRPLYEHLKGEILALGPDVGFTPCSTYVPFRRKKQFVRLTPLKGVLQVGFPTDDLALHPKLQPPQRPEDRFNARIHLTSIDEVDSSILDLIRWFYNQN